MNSPLRDFSEGAVLVPNSSSNPAGKDVDNPWKAVMAECFPMNPKHVLDRVFVNGEYPGKPGEEVVFRFQVNERDVKLPLDIVYGNCYLWKDFVGRYGL